jgi:hypothetical protein
MVSKGATLKLKILEVLDGFLSALVDSRCYWLVWVSIVGLAIGIISGTTSYLAFQHNIPLNGVVAIFRYSNAEARGNIQMFYLSTLIVYSVLGFLGGIISYVVWRKQNRGVSPY